MDIQFSVLQVHCPEVDSKAKAMENCRYTIVPIWIRIETIFRIIISVNQLSLYGAVAEMCEEYETFHDRTGQPVVGGQSSSSLVLSVIKTEVRIMMTLLTKIFCCNSMENELKSYHKKLSKFCMDAGFLNVVEIGQYFMTKDTAEFSQFRAVACREYTLPRDEEASQPKGGNTKIGPVLEIATCWLHGKYGVEIRIMSVNRDNSHSWVRKTNGSNKFVMKLNNNEQEIPEVQLEEYAWNWMRRILHADQRPKQNHKEENLPAFPQEQYLLGKEFGPMLNQGEYSLSDYEISKKLIHLLLHGNQVHQEDDGEVQFWSF